jgi:hypothetical protein
MSCSSVTHTHPPFELENMVLQHCGPCVFDAMNQVLGTVGTVGSEMIFSIPSRFPNMHTIIIQTHNSMMTRIIDMFILFETCTYFFLERGNMR